MKKVYCDVCNKEITKDDDNAQAWLKVIIKLISKRFDGPWDKIQRNEDVCVDCAERLSKFICFIKSRDERLTISAAESRYDKKEDVFYISTSFGPLRFTGTIVNNLFDYLKNRDA